MLPTSAASSARLSGVALVGALAVGLALTGCGADSGSGSGPPIASRAAGGPPRPASVPASIHRGLRRRLLLGRSVQGRAIWAYEVASPPAPSASGRPAGAYQRMLVMGVIHGDERAGLAVTRRLRELPAKPGVDLWMLDDLNPDGAVRGTRQNARGVDLNRNFPYRWQRGGRPGDQQYPGASPLSEPEARIAQRLILRLHPTITLWFHQPLRLVDESGADVAVQRRFARLSGLPLRRLPRYPGSAVGWQNHGLPGTTAFVVELPPGGLSIPAQARMASAVRALARAEAPG